MLEFVAPCRHEMAGMAQVGRVSNVVEIPKQRAPSM